MADGFKKYPKIGGFKNVCNEQSGKSVTVTYGAKVKLHGTNAGIRVSPSGTVTAQKRTSDVFVAADNAGFAAWVETCKGAWLAAVRGAGAWSDTSVVVFGEWAGPGVQRGADAVLHIDQKRLFVFGVRAGDAYFTCPEAVARFVPALDRVHVLPWHVPPDDPDMHVDFDSVPSMTRLAARVNAEVDRVAQEDPYIRARFAVAGPGEGLVLTPHSVTRRGAMLTDGMPKRVSADFTFKAKVEAHRGHKAKAAASAVAKTPESVLQFVEDFVTEARCRQAVAEACDGVTDTSKTGQFLEWMARDVKEEAKLELEQMGSPWKVVARPVKKAAASWFLKECR